MKRVAIDLWLNRLDAAYRNDPFHALRKNIESVRPAEWDVSPAEWSIDEFGAQPELSICDLVWHVAGAKYMYADRVFGAATLEWSDIRPPSREMPALLAWMDEGHRALADGLAALSNDTELANQIVQEGDASPADVFLTENSPAIDVVDDAGLLAPLDEATLDQVDEACAGLHKFVKRIDTSRCGPPAALGVIIGSGYGFRREDGVHVIPIGALGP